MAYVKQDWKNLPDKTTPLNAERMEHIENGIVKNDIFKNLLYMNYSRGTSTTINGVTFTINNDGSISAKGTATSTAYLWLIHDNNQLELDDNKTYTWSLTTVSGTFVDVARIVSKTQSSNLKDISTSVPVRTFQGSFFEDKVICFVRVPNDTTCDYTIKLQLEESSSATEYAPFAGYIVESGVDESGKGSFIKYSDGTMFQYGSITKKLTITNKSTNVEWYYDNGYIINFPTKFADTNYVVDVKSTMLNLVSMNVYSITNYTTNSCEFNLSNGNSQTVNNFTFKWFAIGRWK